MKFLSDTASVFIRELKPTLYDPFTPIFSLAQPVVFLALLGPLVAGIPSTAGDTSWQWFVPGILVMIAISGTSMTGSNLLYEMQTGSHERILVSPLNRPALLVGKSLKEIAPLLAQAAIVVAVMLPFGFELHLAGALTGLAILAVVGVGLGALSYALAIAAQRREWLFWGVQQTLLFPVLILSGVMLPITDGPLWMQTVSRFNPVRHVVDAERALFGGRIASPVVGYGAAAACLIAAIGLIVGVRAVRKASV